MILTTDQILDKIENPHPTIEVLKKEHGELLMHVHGIGVTDYLKQVEGLESDIKIELRKRLARSNKDLFADILRPTDKIFEAGGGSKIYRFKGESTKKEEEFRANLADVKTGYSLTEWLDMYFIDKYTVDPNGLYLIEHKDNRPYPTYKSIYTIKDYEHAGRKLEYVIFEPEVCYKEPLIESSKQEIDYELYRVYDDEGDKLYKLQNDSLTLVEDDSYENPWGYVPAITCSDRINTITNYKRSSIDEQVELAGEYLREGSTKTLYKYHHFFPLFWMYMSTCPACKGVGTVNYTNNSGNIENKGCPSCNGSGWALKKDVSDIKAIKPPETTEEPTVTPDIAGYVVPPLDSLVAMRDEQKLLRDMIFFSHWGTMLNREDAEKTAFEVSVNVQPIQDRLSKYSSSLESTEKEITDMMGEYIYNDLYEGSSINYGRNYVIKSPKEILTAYLEDKGKGANYTVLNDKLEQYYHSLYAHDMQSLIIATKLIKVEPYIHNTIDEVVKWNLAQIDFAQKQYYNEWLSTKEDKYLVNTKVEKLQQELKEFSQNKIIENGEQAKEVQGVQSPEPGQQGED